MKFHRSTANQNLVILRAPSAPPVPRGRPALSNSPRGIAVVPRSSRGCSAVVPRFRGRPGEVRLGRSSYSKIPIYRLSQCLCAADPRKRGEYAEARNRAEPRFATIKYVRPKRQAWAPDLPLHCSSAADAPDEKLAKKSYVSSAAGILRFGSGGHRDLKQRWSLRQHKHRCVSWKELRSAATNGTNRVGWLAKYVPIP